MRREGNRLAFPNGAGDGIVQYRYAAFFRKMNRENDAAGPIIDAQSAAKSTGSSGRPQPVVLDPSKQAVRRRVFLGHWRLGLCRSIVLRYGRLVATRLALGRRPRPGSSGRVGYGSPLRLCSGSRCGAYRRRTELLQGYDDRRLPPLHRASGLTLARYQQNHQQNM